MNKLRMLIVSDQNEFDKKLTSTIKKFSSERNLFFTNLYNSSLNIGSITDLNQNTTSNHVGKSLSKNSGKSIFRGTLLKRCKSSKDIYDKGLDIDSKKLKDGEPVLQRQSYNLDESDMNYLFSQNRRNTVKELRKNFENVPANEQCQTDECMSPISCKPPSGLKKVATAFKRCEFSAVDVDEKRLSFREKQVNDDDQTTVTKRILTRHSFYVQRNGYDSIEDYDDYDGRTRAKLKAQNLINSRAASKPPIKSPTPSMRSKIQNGDGNSNHHDSLDTAILKSRQNLLDMHTFGRRSLNAAIVRDNNLYRDILSDSFEDSKFGIKKSGSVNKIDLEILKSELDDFVDPTWRANIALGYGFRSQRSLSTSKKELDLEQKIDLEIKMREGSAKLLAACNNTKNLSSNTLNGGNANNAHNTQILEAAKNLLTSNERMTAYLAELQRRKRDRDTIAKAKPLSKVSLSEIRMPLMWRDSDHFKNKGDYRRFAVFCLAKIGTEIYDTSLLCPVDRNLTDICFNDAILFTNVTPDFELKLEVYAVMMESDLSIASTPRKIKNTIHSSISRTVGKRLAANLKDELNNTKIGPKFELIASATLTLAEASSEAHTHDLLLTSNNTTLNVNNKLPLFGHFCCRLAVLPDCFEQATQTGHLTMLPKGPTRQVDGYGRLQAFRLELWDDEKAFQANCQSRRCVNITRDTKLKLKGETELVIANMEEGVVEEYIFRAPSNEVQKWCSSIKKTIKEHIQWGHIMLSEPMQLANPGNVRSYTVRSPRQGSLYDQVPILETNDIRQSARPTVHDIFSIPVSRNTSPTMSEFRNRAYSSGRSSTHSSSTISAGSVGSISSRKSHWPFSNK